MPDVADGRVTLLLAERRATLESELTAAAGGASLCATSRTAGSVPTVKYLEGRIAALLELRRTARGQGDELAVAEHLRPRWHAHLDEVAGRGANADWLAYRAGGVDELDELVERLTALLAPPGG